MMNLKVIIRNNDVNLLIINSCQYLKFVFSLKCRFVKNEVENITVLFNLKTSFKMILIIVLLLNCVFCLLLTCRHNNFLRGNLDFLLP
jgi:hypothetical protein